MPAVKPPRKRAPGKLKGHKTPHHGLDVRETVRASYVQDLDATLTELSKKYSVSYRTVMRWKASDALAGDDWDRARRARSLTRAGEETMAANVLTRVTSLFERLMDKIESDDSMPLEKQLELAAKCVNAQQRAISSVRKLAPSLNKFSVATEVMELFARFVAEKFPAQGAQLVPIVKQFGPYVNLHMGRDHGVRA